jgi:hypothetical protein
MIPGPVDSLFPALTAAVASPDRNEWPANGAGSKPASSTHVLMIRATLCAVSRDSRTVPKRHRAS